MTRITEQARTVYRQEMIAAEAADSPDARWSHLERAHIVSQPHPWLHTCNHVAMLALALRQHDRQKRSAWSCGSSSPPDSRHRCPSHPT